MADRKAYQWKAKYASNYEGVSGYGAWRLTRPTTVDGAANEAAKARFEDRELLRQFQEVEQLPDEDKNVVKKLLDAFLTKKQLQALAR